MPINIRRCSVDDAPEVAALGARLFAETYGPTHPEPELSRYLARTFAVDVVRDAIASDESEILVAEIEGRAIGYSILRDSTQLPVGVDAESAVEIVRFYVDTKAQGRGIGGILMKESLAAAGRRGADVAWLQVWKEAPWAVGFYGHIGFTVVGSAPFYFGDQVGDDHIMMIRIGQA